MNDEEVEKLLKEAKIRKLATRDEQEVLGYSELIKEVFTSYDQISFSENTIKQFHQITLKYSEKDKKHKGIYKFGSNRVEAIDHNGKIIGIIFDPTPPHLVPKEMQELVEWTQQAFKNKTYHPFLIIANFIFEYLAIHPFQDGNGRTSRILTNLLLLQNGYSFTPYVSHEKIIEENKVDYYLSLKKTTSTWKSDNEDLTPWLFFFLDIVLKQGKFAVELTKKDQTEKYLSEKQNKIWQCFLEHKKLSRKEIGEKTGVNIKTIEQGLNKLLKMKKIERIGQGRATKYIVIL